MADTFRWNCNNNTEQPTETTPPGVGTINSISTDNATVNSRDVQYSDTTAKKITVSSATVPINKCTIEMNLRLEFAASNSTLKPFIGKYNGALGTDGDWMLVSVNNSIQLFMPGNISTITWESDAINNVHNNGGFGKWELHVNNENPVAGNSYVALYLDDVRQPITANDRTTPWTAVTNTDNVNICAAGYYAVGTMYLDDVLVTDAPPVPPTVTITSPSSDPADIIFIDNFTLAGASSVLSGSVDSVSWVDNRGNSGICTGTTNWTAAITGVVVGNTTYTVTATSDSGGVTTDEIIITYTTDDPPDQDSTFTWNCTDINSSLVGTITTKNTVDTVDDGRDTQYASQSNAVCAKIPSSYISPNVGTIHIFAKFDAGTAENRVIAGSYNGQKIGYLQLYAPSATEGFKLVIYTASGFSTVSNFWSSDEVLDILGDGSYHDVIIQWDRSNLLTATSHMRLKLDGTLISPTTNDASSGWALLPDPSVSYGIGGDPVTTYSLPSMGGHLDFVEILSTAGDIVTTKPITNTTFTSNHMFPVGTNGTAVADIASTITGGNGASLEYQIYNSTSSGVELINGNEWNTVSNLSWAGDDFTCDLPGVPKSKSVYKCYLRTVADPDTVYSLDTVFKVGVKIGFIGQSGAVKLFRTNTGTPDSYTVRFPAGFESVGAAGINLINDLVTLFDCWVEVHEFGVDGSGITEADGGINGWWLTTDGQSASTEYTTFINSVNSRSSSRSEFNFVYWYQGETSAGFGMSRIDYNTNELAFFAQLRDDIKGPGGTVLPIMSVLLARWDDTDPTDAEWAAINQAKIDTVNASVNNYLTAIPDSTLYDLYHLDEASGIRLTTRIAAKTGGIYGVSPVVENPGIDYYEIINSTTTDVYLENCADFTPTTGIDSFTVITTESGRISATGVKQADSVVRLTHAAGTVTDVEVMYGTYPSIANILKSTAAYNLPITPTYFSTEGDVPNPVPAVTITSPTSSPTYETSSGTINISGTSTITGGSISEITWSNSRGGAGMCDGTTSWSEIGITLFEGENEITVTVTSDLGETATDTITVTYTVSGNPVPTINITGPTSSSSLPTTSSSINIAGSCTISAGSISEVTWSNSRGGSGTCDGTTSFSQNGIALLEGVNVITVTATSDLGETSTDTLTVTYSIPSVGGFSMADYLTAKEPDCDDVLNINPSNVIQITPQKNQELIFTDDPTVVVPIEYSSASSYLVPLFFKGLIQSKAKTILDIWNDPTKGNGFARTFCWYNVEDGQIYVVRILSEPGYKYYPYGRCDVSLTLRVEGKYGA